MTLSGLKGWTVRNRRIVAFTLVAFAGYTVGKDMALRDNAREAPSIETNGSRASLKAAV